MAWFSAACEYMGARYAAHVSLDGDTLKMSAAGLAAKYRGGPLFVDGSEYEPTNIRSFARRDVFTCDLVRVKDEEGCYSDHEREEL